MGKIVLTDAETGEKFSTYEEVLVAAQKILNIRVRQTGQAYGFVFCMDDVKYITKAIIDILLEEKTETINQLKERLVLLEGKEVEKNQ